MRKASICSKTGLKRGAWTPEEDRLLTAYIKRYGHWNWVQLPKYAGLSRCGKSCRLRWMNYLRPNINRGNYTREEEELIINLHEKLGNRWSAIAAKLPGRTDNEIKNYWHAHLKKRTNGEEKLSKSEGSSSSFTKSNLCDQDTTSDSQKSVTATPNLKFDLNLTPTQLDVYNPLFILESSSEISALAPRDSKIDLNLAPKQLDIGNSSFTSQRSSVTSCNESSNMVYNFFS
ncbi:hypothetical protein ACHQM5_003515 [Ranunculus cassubicifolius]